MVRGVVFAVLGLLCVHARPVSARAAAAELIFRVPEVLVRHAAADRPVGTTRRHVPIKNETENRSDAGAASSSAMKMGLQYEEYFVEHDIATIDAKRAARELVLSDETAVGCGVCSRREIEYCEARVLADHCCCERHYMEPFPWIPHTCYQGPSVCRPIAGDCVRYARLRDCCCLNRMAKRWKSILTGGASRPSTCLTAVLILAVFLWRIRGCDLLQS